MIKKKGNYLTGSEYSVDTPRGHYFQNGRSVWVTQEVFQYAFEEQCKFLRRLKWELCFPGTCLPDVEEITKRFNEFSDSLITSLTS